MALQALMIAIAAIASLVVLTAVLLAVVGLWAFLTGAAIDRCERCRRYYVHAPGAPHACRLQGALLVVHLPSARAPLPGHEGRPSRLVHHS